MALGLRDPAAETVTALDEWLPLEIVYQENLVIFN